MLIIGNLDSPAGRSIVLSLCLYSSLCNLIVFSWNFYIKLKWLKCGSCLEKERNLNLTNYHTQIWIELANQKGSKWLVQLASSNQSSPMRYAMNISSKEPSSKMNSFHLHKIMGLYEEKITPKHLFHLSRKSYCSSENPLRITGNPSVPKEISYALKGEIPLASLDRPHLAVSVMRKQFSL